jgi:hypothetical protein
MRAKKQVRPGYAKINCEILVTAQPVFIAPLPKQKKNTEPAVFWISMN